VRTHKTILRKVNEWEGNAMMVAGLYRLFIYLPWSLVPEKYKEFFPEEAKIEWDKDVYDTDVNLVKQDIASEIRAILNVIAKKNITQSLGIIPMILADAFIAGQNIGNLHGQLSSIINTYKEHVDLDRQLAEQLAMFEIFELLKLVVEKLKIELPFDMDQAIEQVIEAASKLEVKDSNVEITASLEQQIDKALKDFKDKEKNNETDI
jgi:hypothetical protein